MAQQTLDTTTGAGSTGQAGGVIINANFVEVYSTRKKTPGFYILPYLGCNPLLGSALAAGTAYGMPFPLEVATTISEIGARIATVVASSNVQIAIYANNPATGRPTGTALAATPSFSGATAGNVTGVLSSNVVLPAGIYWAFSASDSAVVLSTVGASASWQNALIGTATLANVTTSNTAAGIGISFPTTFGTWPDVTTGVTFTEGGAASVRAPMAILKVVSQ